MKSTEDGRKKNECQKLNSYASHLLILRNARQIQDEMLRVSYHTQYYDNDNYDLMSYIEVSSSIYCIAVFTIHMALVSFDPQNRPSNSPTF